VTYDGCIKNHERSENFPTMNERVARELIRAFQHKGWNPPIPRIRPEAVHPLLSIHVLCWSPRRHPHHLSTIPPTITEGPTRRTFQEHGGDHVTWTGVTYTDLAGV